ncbi:heterokaryon incompatibility protein-domain-containing protein, partial [Cadophora sp. MPI-SDFR-AT-0126]
MSKNDEELDPLCDYCKEISQILGSNISEAVKVQHHETYQAFLKAAQGCRLCCLIVQSLGKFRDRIVGIQCSCSQELKIRVEYFQYGQSNAEADLYFELFRNRGNPVNSDRETSGRSIFRDPVEAVIGVALPWISDCQNTHVKCHQNDQGHLPTRVMDVGEDGDDVILRESKDISGKYAVLSHCWGNERALTTTTASIKQHMKVILFSGLPATFLDAVKITRMLGIKYLWIDSLCIIQDQLSDWEHESAKMHEYYRNSYVTIAALDSKNSFAGILHQREVRSIQLLGSGKLFLRRKMPTARSIYENSILESRAWCLQERLLSTRVINMGKSEILFECRTGHQRESSALLGDSFATQGFYRFGPDRLKRVLDGLESDPKSAERAPGVWYDLVQQYSRRNLTNPEDMLPAILGVAEQVKTYTGLTYMYGLWKEDMARGLLWANDRRSFSEVSEEERQQTGEPGWSWAAMTGYVKYWPMIQPSLLLGCKLDWDVSRSSDRELILRSRCFYVYLQESKPPSFRAFMQYWDTTNVFHIYYHESHNLQRYTDQVRGARVGWMFADEKINPANLNQCKAVEIIGADLKHLDETKGDSYNESREGYTMVPVKVWFLVVVPHPDIVGCWKRIGIGMSGNSSFPYDDAPMVEVIKPELIFEGAPVESMHL